jgi:DNA-binding SARP family transcriptional activator
MPDRLNPILESILSSDYERGLRIHRKLNPARPEDDRWAGYCLFAAGRLLEAKDLLQQSLAAGCQAALIELATVFRQLADFENAYQAITGLDFEQLSDFDRALAERELGVIHSLLGQPIQATEALERAWAAALSTEISLHIRSGIAHVLASMYEQRGLERQAGHYFELALKHASGSKRLYPLIKHGLALTHAGRFTDAENALQEAQRLLKQAPNAEPVAMYYLGVLQRAQGRWAEALETFATASQHAKTILDAETEFFAILGSAAIEIGLGRLDAARAHLSRARALATDDRKRAFLALREGSMWTVQDDQRAADRLEGALEAFEQMGMRREAAWASLHLSEVHLRAGHQDAADRALEAAADVRHALGSGTAIVLELRGLPNSFDRVSALPKTAYAAVLFEDWRSLEGSAPVTVQIVTLGVAQVVADGRVARLTMRRGPEVIAYLLLNPDVTRDHLLAALWPDAAPDAAANYMHQVRHELARVVPGLAIVFDRTTKRYSVSCEGPRLRFDAADIKSLLSADEEDDLERAVRAYTGSFLPQAESDWARSERETLEWSVIKAGLRLMDSWSTRGDFGKCLQLAQRLLEIEPLNEVLAEYLVSATMELEGHIAARRALEDIARRYRDEVGELPSRLQDLDRQIDALVGTLN